MENELIHFPHIGRFVNSEKKNYISNFFAQV